MDMNEFEDAGESSSMGSPDAATGAGGSELGLHEEIRRLRFQLERLEASQGRPHPDDSHLSDEPAEEIDVERLTARGDAARGDGARAEAARPRRLTRLLLVVIAAAILSVGGVRSWKYLQSYQNTDDAQVDGYLDPISSRINGTVSTVYVDNNQSVKAGRLLVQLDPRDYEVAVEQARAQLAQAQADLNSARQQYVSAGATIRQAEAQNYLAQRNVARYAELIKVNVISQAEFDQYDATARAQAATVKVDEAATESAQRIIASRAAQVQAAQALLNQAELNLSYTRIVAPADGIIGNRSAQLGQRVQPGQSLMALTQTDNLWVTANFKETQLARMRRDQTVVIHIDAVGRDYKGHVENMPGATGSLYDLLPPENATGNYVKIVQRLPVRILFDRGQDLSQLRPGMSVEPKVWLR
jgi:membrane fusion protein (multidrug efflux system)